MAPGDIGRELVAIAHHGVRPQVGHVP
jgi:hypothetical protein